MAGFGDFAKKIMSKDVKKNIANNTTAYAYKIYTNIELLSPIDTGQYLRNNRITIGDRSDFDSANGNNSKSALDNYTDISKPIFIQNNLPYAIPIEDGHSKMQAPRGVYSEAVRLTKFKPKGIIK